MDQYKIYGIEFDETIPVGGEKRICDSVGMENDYVIGNAFAKGGKNDFDHAFPFGAIRLCNVRIENEKTSLIFEGEEGFSRDGSGGNVMVQIPKFYARREKEGSIERWMISGVCHPGFSVEPAFLRDGKELDFVYVGAYNSATLGNGIFSYTGTSPDFCLPQAYYREEYGKAGYDVYDLAIHLMLQRLIAIEFCNRKVKYELGGFLFVEYYYRLRENTVIVAKGKNCVVKNRSQRNDLYYPGMQIMFNCKKPHDPDPILRTLTKVEADPEGIRLYYDGEDLSDQLPVGESSVGGIFQKNGHSDCLPYHTGRCGNIPPLTEEAEIIPLVNAFRYRGIENVWGNVWEYCDGLRIQDLQYYYTFEPNQYNGCDITGWNKTAYPATQQNFLGVRDPMPPIWASEMGFDPATPLLPLPTATSHGKPGDFYDAGYYCYHDRDYDDQPVDPHILYSVATGGGYDHFWFGSLFTYRCFLKEGTRSWLYSNRLCLRK